MIRRDATAHTMTIPVVLPLVEATITGGEQITVVLDGQVYEPQTPLTRANLRAQITTLASARGTPLRVQVKDADGRTFTDIITPADTTPAPAAPAPHQAHSAGSAGGEAEPFQITGPGGVVVGLSGSGFLPGEHVAFAVIVLRRQADADGTAVLHLPAALTMRKPGPFVLFGQTSGTLVRADPFGGDPA